MSRQRGTRSNGLFRLSTRCINRSIIENSETSRDAAAEARSNAFARIDRRD